MRIEKLTPAFKDYIWGGVKLKTRFGKITDCTPCAESWELSFHRDGETRLSDGRRLADALSPEELGANVADFEFFPMLVKFIDANDNLSIQVHPTDRFALANENSYGKTELWYIVDADEGAGLYIGFKNEVTRAEFESAIREDRLPEILNFVPVKRGERYFIPSGTVHAIGRGCLICEIQQNSNLTYRVYDFGRLGADGKPRELHVDRALEVSRLAPYAPAAADFSCDEGEMIGASRYFTAYRLAVSGERSLALDRASFRLVTCVEGAGRVGEHAVAAGDSLFVSACEEELSLSGEMTLLISSVRRYNVGIDLGGTYIKGGIVDDLGRIVAFDSTPTHAELGDRAVAERIASLAESLLARLGMSSDDVGGIGIGVPGMIDSAAGRVVYSNNLGWKNFCIGESVSTLTGLDVRIGNDANVAALGESTFGCGKNYSTTVMLTLGTGVGGGIVIDGRLFEGNRSAGAELGHSVIALDGERCTCGRRGCLEAYASAGALVRATRRAMEADRTSAMWEIGSVDHVDGSTAFRYAERGDAAAQAVVDRYIRALAAGITNLANELRPEAVILGGGLSAEGERLCRPLREIVDREIFGGSDGPSVEVLTATLGNRAGVLGAAALVMKK